MKFMTNLLIRHTANQRSWYSPSKIYGEGEVLTFKLTSQRYERHYAMSSMTTLSFLNKLDKNYIHRHNTRGLAKQLRPAFFPTSFLPNSTSGLYMVGQQLIRITSRLIRAI